MLGNVCLSDTLAHKRYEFVTVSKKDQASNEFSIAQQDTGETRNNNYPNINLRMASYQEDYVYALKRERIKRKCKAIAKSQSF